MASKSERDDLLDAVRAVHPPLGVMLLYAGYLLVIFFVCLEIAIGIMHDVDLVVVTRILARHEAIGDAT